jgi:hypothetical protein
LVRHVGVLMVISGVVWVGGAADGHLLQLRILAAPTLVSMADVG